MPGSVYIIVLPFEMVCVRSDESYILAVTWLRDMADYTLNTDQSLLAIFHDLCDVQR